MIYIIEKQIVKMEFEATIKFVKIQRILILLALVLPCATSAQETITLNQCFDLVTKNYPLAKQPVMLSDQSRLDIEAINKGKLPKFDVNAQAG